MAFIRDNVAFIDLNVKEKLQGDRVKQYEKYYYELKESFLDQEAVSAIEKEVAYSVYSIDSPSDDNEYFFGITVIEPTLVANECTMTRGHYHEDRDYGEVYIGLDGEGFVMYWDGENPAYLEKVFKGSIHLIDGKYAHRLINTGTSQLSVGTIWSKHAGHNYGAIEKTGFPLRVFKEDDKVIIKEV